MQVYFEQRVLLAPGVWEYYFRPERPIDFVPGQYLNLYLPDTTGDYRGSARTFTLTSVPHDASLSFVVKIPEPHSVYKQVLIDLKEGDEAKVNDAMGDLVLPKSADVPLVYIAGGIGMASYAAMLKSLLAKREERAIFLFYALRDRRDRIFSDLAKSYPLQLNADVIAPNRLTATQVLASVPPDSLLYLSGSQRFVEGLQFQFEQLGIPRSQIVFDYYDGYTEL